MTGFIIKLLLFTTLFIAVWSGILRPWLRSKPWMKGFFANPVVEWIELNIYRKSESLAWSRWLVFLGTGLTTVGQFDPTMIQTIAQFFPEGPLQKFASAAPMLITLAGFLGERLRRDTSKPLELVAVTEEEKTKEGPVKEAIEAAKIVQEEAILAIAEEKAS